MDCNICNNCGKMGHLFQQCNLPINSFGIIAYTMKSAGAGGAEATPHFLMIRRKDSFGYIDFLRGKYSPYNYYQLRRIVDEMSIHEKAVLAAAVNAVITGAEPVENVFYRLWTQMWGKHLAHDFFEKLTAPIRYKYKSEEDNAFKKFQTIIAGVNNYIHSAMTATSVPTQYNLTYLIETSTTQWTETEWELPKGRRNNPREKEITCAIREFEEETGIHLTHTADAHIIEQCPPFEETFIGTNCKAYKHKYFLAYIADYKLDFTTFQRNEVSKIECVGLDEAMTYIRPYNIEKKQLMQSVYDYIIESGSGSRCGSGAP
jgi:8-oxo-dGTP pyrophosphatase MutT (NUDIX family)